MPGGCPLKDAEAGGPRPARSPSSGRSARGTQPSHGPRKRSWDRAMGRLGLPAYTPHDMRHTWTTVALTNGVSIHEVSRRLGHRSIKVTVDRHGHLTQDGQERCRRVVEVTVGPYMLTAGRATAAPGAGTRSAPRASRRNRPRPYRP
ncbi:tyrosine-type recombinase/integrase [Streptomyces sp. NPDC002913]